MKKIVAALLVLALGLGGWVSYQFMPTPDILRNGTVEGVRMEADVPGDERKPIIRTFLEDEFNALSVEDFSEVKDKVDGKLEGDIPAVDLNRAPYLYLRFQADGKIVTPENLRVTIFAHASDYRDPERLRKIEGTLEPLTGYEGVLRLPLKRYSVQYERYFMEYLRLEVRYKINGENFVSTFGVFQNNAEDGTDFFENENLPEPVQPE